VEEVTLGAAVQGGADAVGADNCPSPRLEIGPPDNRRVDRPRPRVALVSRGCTCCRGRSNTWSRCRGRRRWAGHLDRRGRLAARIALLTTSVC
jgi:hypothetical protein